MRKEPYSVGSIVHVVKRGSRGFPIVRDDLDRWRFLLMLEHFNDEFSSENWFRQLMEEKIANTFKRPAHWPERKKIVKILSFCLVENHFHLLLEEIKDGGISRFMQKFGISMAKHFNEKYHEKGSLFQGAYRSRTVHDDTYLRYVSAYIQVKNAFELYPGGYKKASQEFNAAFAWATGYLYCSLGNFLGERGYAPAEKSILSDLFTKTEYKAFARDFILGRATSAKEELDDELMEKVPLE